MQDHDVARIGQQRLRRRVRLERAGRHVSERQAPGPRTIASGERVRAAAIQAAGHAGAQPLRKECGLPRRPGRRRPLPRANAVRWRAPAASASSCLARTVAAPSPPHHAIKAAAAALLLFARDLQHGRHAVVAHRQQQAGRSFDRFAVRERGPSGRDGRRDSIAAVAAHHHHGELLGQLLAHDLDGAPVGPDELGVELVPSGSRSG